MKIDKSVMNILVCTFEYYPEGTGIANVAYFVVEQLKSLGVKCTVCSPNGPDIKIGRLINKSGIFGLLYFWYKVAKYCKNKDYDIIWAHHPLFSIKIPPQRKLVTMHTTYFGMFNQNLTPKIYYKIAFRIEKHCLNKLSDKTKFTIVSPEICFELGKMGINRRIIEYIPNGVDIHLYRPRENKKIMRKKFGIPEDNIILLSIGRLTEMKQPIKLLNVFSFIEKEIKDIILIIAGEGELLSEIKEYINIKNIRNVKILGYVDEKDKPDLYSCSDYFVMASRYEGQPLTLLEAMASGLPCIVNNLTNLKIVEEAKCGIIVNFDNVKTTVQKIVKYLKTENISHSQNARSYSTINLDWKNITERYLNVFEALLKNNNKKY